MQATFTRRQALAAGTLLLLQWPLARRALSDEAKTLDTSETVYITPLKKNGNESKCHAEVWFVHHQGAVVVCTAATAWRSKAIAKGLKHARLWVGEYGPWTKSQDFMKAPHYDAEASLITDAAQQSAILKSFGGKYVREWSLWGPRFENGLKSGERVLIQYRLTS